MAGPDGDEDPVVKVTAINPAITVAPSTAPANTACHDDGAAHHAARHHAAAHHRARHHPAAHSGSGAGRAPLRWHPPPSSRPPQQPAASTAPRPEATVATGASDHRRAPRRSAGCFPPAPPADAVGFSASAAFGSCSEDPPYDVYSGTASPGTWVAISSAFGGGSAQADEHGHWEAKVVFSGAPLNETFSVTVSSAQGSDTFSFTHTG